MNMRSTAKAPRLFVCILAAACCLAATDSMPDEPTKVDNPAVDLMLGNEPGQVRDDNALKLKFVWCPPGEFSMGSPKSEVGRKDNEDRVEVTLTKGYWLGKYEVTQAEWKQEMATEPWKDGTAKQRGAPVADDFPATFVSWDDAMEFCRKLTKQERKSSRLPADWEYTLPTEAQWERACRAGTETSFSFGDDESRLGEFAWFHGNAWDVDEKYAHRVGQKKQNPWGHYDMHGNVWEWCRDYYAKKVSG